MSKPTIFFDMDGVLADFVLGAFALHGRSVPMEDVRWDFLTQIGFDGVNDPAFWEPMGFDFWAGLPAYEDGMQLLARAAEMVGADRIGLLTSPCDTPGCVDGKRDWVARRLPAYRKRLFVGSAKQLFAGPGKILVDDHDANADAFRAAGGQTFQPPRPWNRYRPYCLPGGAFDVWAAADRLDRLVQESPVPCPTSSEF